MDQIADRGEWLAFREVETGFRGEVEDIASSVDGCLFLDGFWMELYQINLCNDCILRASVRFG